MASRSDETYIQRKIDDNYELLEITLDEEDVEEKKHKNKIKAINKKIKKLKNEKKQLKLEFEQSKYTFYKCKLCIRNSVHLLHRELDSLNIE